MGLDSAVFIQMQDSDRAQCSRQEAEIIARMIQTPEDVVDAIWRYGAVGWLRGQRFDSLLRRTRPPSRSWRATLLTWVT